MENVEAVMNDHSAPLKQEQLERYGLYIIALWMHVANSVFHSCVSNLRPSKLRATAKYYNDLLYGGFCMSVSLIHS